uniref:Uncharacterized protein n=1 Tax=Arundo donax TaxID=35708 RepID=A0A0A9G861_ARUDO
MTFPCPICLLQGNYIGEKARAYCILTHTVFSLIISLIFWLIVYLMFPPPL